MFRCPARTATLLLSLLSTVTVSGDETCCDAVLNFGFSRTALSSEQPFAGLSGTGEECLAGGGEWTIEGGAGRPAATTVFVNIVSQFDEGAVQGWSVSLQITGAARVTGATTDGTTGALASGQGFNTTGVVDPGANDGRHGAVSAVILCFGCKGSLPQRGTESVLRLDIESSALGDADDDGELAARLFHEDGLRLTGQPVTNRATLSGMSVVACNSADASLSLSFVEVAPSPFVRGDVNADGGIDIADPVFLLNHLFGGGPPAPCESASDTNNDGAVNIADPVFELNSLFGGGGPMAAPHPDCGLETGGGLSCVAFPPCSGA